MRITLTTPNHKAPNGGIRLINDFCSGLEKRGHEVSLWDEYTNGRMKGLSTDLLIVCSPHSDYILDFYKGKAVIWCQMLEHMFREDDTWTETCNSWYKRDIPFITNANWITNYVDFLNITGSTGQETGSKALRTWIPELFTPENPIQWFDKNKQFTILLESPLPNNQTKDVDRIGYKAAVYAKDKYKAKIIGYGARPFKMPMDDYKVQPFDSQIIKMYEQAHVLIKATKYDGRACAPLEAMPYGCVPIRAINNGDEHLNESNSYKCNYDLDELINQVDLAFKDMEKLKQKSKNCIEFAKGYRFDPFIKEFSEAIGIEL